MSSQSNEACQEMHERYGRALHLVKGVFTDDITYNDVVFPQWIGESDCFWYERVTDSDRSGARGAQYRLVDARAGTNIEAFDHAKLAESLSKAAGVEVNPDKLPLQDLRMEVCSEDNHSRTVKTITFRANDQTWFYDVETGNCSSVQSCPVEWVVSPDGKTAVFVKDNNLWLHDIQSGKERALTFDGERHYRYGFAGNGWAEPFHLFVQARWSSDSKRIFTVQHDERKVESLPVTYYVPNEGVRPVVKNYKLALPGDAHVATFRLLSIEVETGRMQDANYRAIPDTRNGRGLFEAGLGWWSSDNRHAYFIDVERDYKTVRLVEFDTDNGETRTVFKETTETQINLMAYGDDYPALTPLLTTKELLWYSERSGWAHLYLYDLETGNLKNPVTQGDWVVRHLVRVDEERREAYVLISGRDPEKNPYYCEFCRVNIDSGEMTTLMAGDHDIMVANMKDANAFMKVATRTGAIGSFPPYNGVSPSGDYSVVTRTRVDEQPASVVLDRSGGHVTDLEVSDLSALPKNWRWPEPVVVDAADGKTKLSAVIYRPSDFSDSKRYPVIINTSPTPDFPSTPKGAFSAGALVGFFYYPSAALAELGFIVLNIDTRGHAGRSKAFKDHSYGWLDSVCDLDDLVYATRQIAEVCPNMDLERVGISTLIGGPGAVQGLLKRPDFFKVGVSAMLHDSRLMTAPMWGEMFEGLAEHPPERKFPEAFASNLKGKLLLINGMLDVTTPPSIAFRVIEALQSAGKRFDMLLLPNLSHDLSTYAYVRVFDYFVENLLNEPIPEEIAISNESILTSGVGMIDDGETAADEPAQIATA